MQAGLRKGRCCLDHIFTLNGIIRQHLSKPKKKLYGLFIDFARCFPSINHHLLWKRLLDMGVSTKIVKILEDIYWKANTKIKLEGTTTTAIEITEGLLQGDTISPLLFSLFVADMDDHLISMGQDGIKVSAQTLINLLMYADDT